MSEEDGCEQCIQFLKPLIIKKPLVPGSRPGGWHSSARKRRETTMAEEPQVGFVTMGDAAAEGDDPVDRDRHARLRVHGQGAHERAEEDRVHARGRRPTSRGSSRSAGATRRRSRRPRGATATRSGRPTGRTSSRTRTSRCSTTAGRTTSTSSRRSRRRRRASTSSARSRSGGPRTRATRSGRASPTTGVKAQ